MTLTIFRFLPPQTANPPSFGPAPPRARSAAEQKVLERAAQPKHLGAAFAKKLRGLLPGVAAERDRLKDAARNALSAYNDDPSDENKKMKFLNAFTELRDSAPISGYSSHVRAHGEETNPAFDKFLKEIEKLQQAYNILIKS
ncbi:MAG TPA: hypothetical protein VIG66_02395 [Noviherbaspirillum sp.]